MTKVQVFWVVSLNIASYFLAKLIEKIIAESPKLTQTFLQYVDINFYYMLFVTFLNIGILYFILRKNRQAYALTIDQQKKTITAHENNIKLLKEQISIKNKKSKSRHSDQVSQEAPKARYIKTGLCLQFFGDLRIPQEVSSNNVASWLAYFSPSLKVNLKNTQEDTVPGCLGIPPNWVISIALDLPAKFRQAVVSFSNPEVMPITDIHMANSRLLVIATRDQVPAGILNIHVIE